MDEILALLKSSLKDEQDIPNREKIKELVKAFTTQCNHFGVKTQEIADTIAADDEAKDVFLKFVVTYIKYLRRNYEKGFYDGRNEIACERAFRLAYALGLETTEDEAVGFECRSPIRYDIAFAVYMGAEHRTLQQTFSKIVFYMLKEYSKYSDMIQKAIENDEIQDEFWYMPLI